MKRLLIALAAILVAATANAQSVAQFQLGFGNPSPLQIRDRNSTWITMGTVDSITHIFNGSFTGNLAITGTLTVGGNSSLQGPLTTLGTSLFPALTPGRITTTGDTHTSTTIDNIPDTSGITAMLAAGYTVEVAGAGAGCFTTFGVSKVLVVSVSDSHTVIISCATLSSLTGTALAFGRDYYSATSAVIVNTAGAQTILAGGAALGQGATWPERVFGGYGSTPESMIVTGNSNASGGPVFAARTSDGPQNAASYTFTTRFMHYCDSNPTNAVDIRCFNIYGVSAAEPATQGDLATVTISNAAPAVISWAGHTLAANNEIVFSTTSALPDPLVPAIKYYVIAAGLVPGVSFEISATVGGAAINTTSAGAGTHTALHPRGIMGSEMEVASKWMPYHYRPYDTTVLGAAVNWSMGSGGGGGTGGSPAPQTASNAFLTFANGSRFQVGWGITNNALVADADGIGHIIESYANTGFQWYTTGNVPAGRLYSDGTNIIARIPSGGAFEVLNSTGSAAPIIVNTTSVTNGATAVTLGSAAVPWPTIFGNAMQYITPVTIAAIGTCNAGAKGTTKYVSDTVSAAAPAYRAVIAGGGATTVNGKGECDGTNWVWD